MISVSETRDFTKIEKEWGRLYDNNSTLTYYQSVPYMRVLWKNLLLYRFILRVSPRFYVFHEKDNTIMILPLFKRWGRREYVGYGYKSGVGYIDAIYSETIETKKISECFNALKEIIGNARIHFKHVRDKTALGQWLLENGGVISDEGCTEIPLPESYEEYYNSLSKHMKQNIRTAYNRLKTDDGEFECECLSYSKMQGKEKELQNMYIDRQISRYEKSRLYKFFVKYVDLGTKIQQDDGIEVKAYILYINGKLAAYYDAIFTEDEIIIPRLAIADDFDRYSPGVMLLNESIKKLIEKQIKNVDLTHGTESYKLSMGGKINKCVECDLKEKLGK